jgi:hypothetical protein
MNESTQQMEWTQQTGPRPEFETEIETEIDYLEEEEEGEHCEYYKRFVFRGIHYHGRGGDPDRGF